VFVGLQRVPSGLNIMIGSYICFFFSFLSAYCEVRAWSGQVDHSFDRLISAGRLFNPSMSLVLFGILSATYP